MSCMAILFSLPPAFVEQDCLHLVYSYAIASDQFDKSASRNELQHHFLIRENNFVCS